MVRQYNKNLKVSECLGPPRMLCLTTDRSATPIRGLLGSTAPTTSSPRPATSPSPTDSPTGRASRARTPSPKRRSRTPSGPSRSTSRPSTRKPPSGSERPAGPPLVPTSRAHCRGRRASRTTTLALLAGCGPSPTPAASGSRHSTPPRPVPRSRSTSELLTRIASSSSPCLVKRLVYTNTGFTAPKLFISLGWV